MLHTFKRQAPRQLNATSRRHFSRFPAVRKQDDGLESKDNINTESREYSKTGGDGAAAHSKDAFATDKTRPEEQSGAGNPAEDPLNVSPANQKVSQARDPQEGGAQGSAAETGQGASARQGESGKGSSPKSGSGPGKR